MLHISLKNLANQLLLAKIDKSFLNSIYLYEVNNILQKDKHMSYP